MQLVRRLYARPRCRLCRVVARTHHTIWYGSAEDYRRTSTYQDQGNYCKTGSWVVQRVNPRGKANAQTSGTTLAENRPCCPHRGLYGGTGYGECSYWPGEEKPLSVNYCGKSWKHQLFFIVHLLLGKSKTTPLPSDKSASELCSLFGDFFVEKISKIRNSIPTESNDDNPEVPECSSTMAFFETVAVEEITKLVTSITNKSCELDAMPT